MRRLSEFIKIGNVKIRVYTKRPLHAKAYIFKYKKEHAEANRAEGIGIVGSSNLTISGFHHNTELNTYVRGQNNYEELNKWFNALWEEAVPFNELLAERFEESWAIKTVNPYDIYILTLYHRSAKTGKKPKGTYAFFRAGDIAKLMVQTPKGWIVDDFSEVINEIRCDRDCTEAGVNEGQKEKYFGDLEGLRKVFKDAISKERIRLRPHSEVLKTKKRLQDMMGLFSSQEVRENIERLDKVLNEYFPHQLVPLLKRLNKGKHSEEQYLNELIDIYNRERLPEITDKTQKDETKKQIEFVCGENLV